MPLWNEYYTPTTIDEALRLLSRDDDALLVGGGTDLILDLQQGNHAPVQALVDVTTIPALHRIAEEDGWIVLGAAVTHAEIEANELVRRHGAALAESCRVVGGPQVRNVATLGGNVAHALPAADGTIGLLALGAEAQVYTLGDAGVSGEWRPLPTLFAGPGKNTLTHHQLIGAFRFRARTPGQGSAFDRIMRPQGVALPILGLAACLTLDAGRTRIVDAAVAVGPAGPVPFRATEAERILAGADRFDEDVLTAAVAAAQAQAELRTSKHRASKEYRREMVAVLMRRVVPRAFARAQA
jgi:carbon-monoxide dehydrogenase medium subunit